MPSPTRSSCWGRAPASSATSSTPTAETSLGGTDRYKAVAARAGSGAGVAFVDVTAMRELLEGAMANADAAERAQYEQEIKPFLEPFDALIGSTSVNGRHQSLHRHSHRQVGGTRNPWQYASG